MKKKVTIILVLVFSIIILIFFLNQYYKFTNDIKFTKDLFWNWFSLNDEEYSFHTERAFN